MQIDVHLTDLVLILLSSSIMEIIRSMDLYTRITPLEVQNECIFQKRMLAV